MTPLQRIKGVLSPVVTPFNSDLSPDPQRFIAQCQWLISQNCGLAIFGTNSEANSQSVSERLELLEALVAADLDTTRMMPGTGCCALTDTVRLTKHAVHVGEDQAAVRNGHEIARLICRIALHVPGKHGPVAGTAAKDEGAVLDNDGLLKERAVIVNLNDERLGLLLGQRTGIGLSERSEL